MTDHDTPPDQLGALETALRDLGVTRLGAIYGPAESADDGAWRVTLTTTESDSRDGEGTTLAEALVQALWAVAEMQDAQALLGSKAGA